MATPLDGRVAVITGSTGGMGEGIARRLAADGASVVISGRRVEQGQQVAQSIIAGGGHAIFVRADVVCEEDCTGLIRETLRYFDRLDILVNNAAITPVEPPGDQSVELWDDVYNVIVRGAFLCCREAIPVMRRQGGGRIVNIGSILGYSGPMERLAYATAKGALLCMTKSMARSLLQDHILVNWVTVGWVATPNEIDLRNKTHGDGQAFLDERGRTRPLGRLETVDDIAAGVLYLVSDEASHVTGCELNVSGGMRI